MLAAAGLVALEETPKILHRDHENARYLAEGLAKIRGVAIDPKKVATNIVIFDVRATGSTAAESGPSSASTAFSVAPPTNTSSAW